MRCSKSTIRAAAMVHIHNVGGCCGNCECYDGEWCDRPSSHDPHGGKVKMPPQSRCLDWTGEISEKRDDDG
jgi:hypothetical protein